MSWVRSPGQILVTGNVWGKSYMHWWHYSKTRVVCPPQLPYKIHQKNRNSKFLILTQLTVEGCQTHGIKLRGHLAVHGWPVVVQEHVSNPEDVLIITGHGNFIPIVVTLMWPRYQTCRGDRTRAEGRPQSQPRWLESLRPDCRPHHP